MQCACPFLLSPFWLALLLEPAASSSMLFNLSSRTHSSSAPVAASLCTSKLPFLPRVVMTHWTLGSCCSREMMASPCAPWDVYACKHLSCQLLSSKRCQANIRNENRVSGQTTGDNYSNGCCRAQQPSSCCKSTACTMCSNYILAGLACTIVEGHAAEPQCQITAFSTSPSGKTLSRRQTEVKADTLGKCVEVHR